MKALLLDAGGTIIFPNFHRIAEELAKVGIKADPKDLMRAEAKVRFEMDRPEIILAGTDSQRWVEYLKNIFSRVGVKSAKKSAEVIKRLKKYHDRHNLWEFMPEEIPEELDALGRKMRLGVVSNSNGTVRALLSRLGVAHRFETIVDSQEEGIEKPDPRIFHAALTRMRLSAPETAYVGDFYYVDVVGARKAGLVPFLLDPLGLHKDKPVRRVKSLREIADLAL